MKFGLPKKQTSRRFNYTPRYYQGKTEGNRYDFDGTIAKYRDISNANDFGSQWAEARKQGRNRRNGGASKRLFGIVIILVIIFLYLIEFDLTIFTSKR